MEHRRTAAHSAPAVCPLLAGSCRWRSPKADISVNVCFRDRLSVLALEHSAAGENALQAVAHLGLNLADGCGTDAPGFVKVRPACAIGLENAVDHDAVEVHVGIEQRTGIPTALQELSLRRQPLVNGEFRLSGAEKWQESPAAPWLGSHDRPQKVGLRAPGTSGPRRARADPRQAVLTTRCADRIRNPVPVGPGGRSRAARHPASPTAVGRALASMHATLVKLADRQVVAQKTFGVERNATTPDAAGGAKAFAQTADEVIESIVAWTAEQTTR